MNYILEDSLATQIPLPAKWCVDFPKYSFNKKQQQSYKKDGAFIRGDGTAMARTFKVSFSQTARTDAAMRSAIQTIFGFLLQRNAPYYLVDLDNNIRWEVDVSGFSPSAKKGLEYYLHQGSMTLLSTRAFPEDNTVNQEGPQSMLDGDTLVVNCTGDIKDIFPVIYVTAVDNITEFSLEVDTTELNIVINDSSFSSGSQYVLDSINGTVKLAGQDRLYTIIDGGMLRLQPGANTITYNSVDGEVQLTVDWRNRYSF